MPNPSATLLNVSHIASIAAKDTALMNTAIKWCRVQTLQSSWPTRILTVQERLCRVYIDGLANFLSHYARLLNVKVTLIATVLTQNYKSAAQRTTLNDKQAKTEQAAKSMTGG
jgi:hypothetical protein